MLDNMVVPEVMKKMVNATIGKMLGASRYAKVDTTLVGQPGDEVTIPTWHYIGMAGEVAEGEAAPEATLKASTKKLGIKTAAKTVMVTDEMRNSAYGDPLGQVERQLALSIFEKVESDCMEQFYTATRKVGDGSEAISFKGLVRASTAIRGKGDKVLFINPAQEADLLSDDKFLENDRLAGQVLVNGAIGRAAGAQVVVSDLVRLIQFEKNDSGDVEITAENLAEYQAKCAEVLEVGNKVKALAKGKSYYLNPIVRIANPTDNETETGEPALTILLKKDTDIEADRTAKMRITEVTATKYYGVGLTNDSKVVLAKFKG